MAWWKPATLEKETLVPAWFTSFFTPILLPDNQHLRTHMPQIFWKGLWGFGGCFVLFLIFMEGGKVHV